MFDFIQFCEEHRIPYVTQGVNKKVSDDCNVSCPFCNETADPDPSFHLGVDSERQVYSCWRNPRKHRGRTLHRLIMKLLRCSYQQACELLGQQPLWLKEGQFEQLADDPTQFFIQHKEQQSELMLLDEFHQFGTTRHAEIQFIDYLLGRGFKEKHLPTLTKNYRLHWTVSGRYRQRVIIPLYQDARLVGWTSRSIHPKTPTRYLTLSEDEGALLNVKKMIFNWDSLINEPQDLVVVCEGPFDALKVDYFGKAYGLRATCLFSQMATMEQVAYIAALTDLYQKVIIMLDDTATLLAESLCDQLPMLPVEAKALPSGFHDPGELTSAQVWKLSKQWLSEIML